MTANIDVSIVVVSWNVCDLLEACLRSIQQYVEQDHGRYEVHVIDNHSADNSAAMVRERFPSFSLTENLQNTGFGRANNQALRACRGRYVLLLNPDTEVQEDAIGRMLTLMDETPEAAILGARLINSDRSFQRASGGALPTLYNVAWHYLFFNQLLPKRLAPPPTYLINDIQGTFDVGWVSGAALMLRRKAVGKTIFDERFFLYGEDLDLCDRMLSSGWRVLYTSQATVMHHLRQSLARQTSETIRAHAIEGNRAYFRRRHGRFKTCMYDLILTTGYLLRWPCFGLLSVFNPGAGYEEKSLTSRGYAWVSLRSLLRGGG